MRCLFIFSKLVPTTNRRRSASATNLLFNDFRNESAIRNATSILSSAYLRVGIRDCVFKTSHDMCQGAREKSLIFVDRVGTHLPSTLDW